MQGFAGLSLFSVLLLMGLALLPATTPRESSVLRRSRDIMAVMLLVVLLTVAAGALVGLVLTRLRVLPGTTAAASLAGLTARAVVVTQAPRTKRR